MARKRRKARVQQPDTEKRREANRRYYQSHPDIKEKNRARMAEKREEKKKYRRQWDPPKKLKAMNKRRPTVRDDGSVAGSSQYSASTEDILKDEAAAHAALSALYHRTRRELEAIAAENRQEPKSLTEIAAYESSLEGSESGQTAADNSEVRSPPIKPTVTKAKTATAAASEAWLDAERAARMRIVVESGRSWEAVERVYKLNGSVGVERWLRGVEQFVLEEREAGRA
ncbi:hypothetical protein DFH06DRAFT_1318533 [Mycena polygramma]|nr:hypothetical protein DFH06DRAFT_1318533 [Mycena polygramma]